MKKMVMAALLAATVATPIAAQASAGGQDSSWQGRQNGQGDPRNGDGRPGNRAQAQNGTQDQGPPQVQAGVQAGIGQQGDRGAPDRRGPQGQQGDAYRGGPGGPGGNDRPDGARYGGGQYGSQPGRGGPGYAQGQYDGRDGGQPGRGGPGYAQGQYGGRDGGYRGGQPGYGDPRGGPGIGQGGGWNNGWRQDRRYDWNGYRQQNRRAFGLPRYAAPYGWRGGYRRFSVGVSLSRVLFDRTYWIQDPWAYRLPPAYGPYRWVRYYNDALLVDVRGGAVVDGVYGIFY